MSVDDTRTTSATARTDEDAVSAVRGVLVAGDRPPRASGLTTSLTFGWRALLKIKHVPEQLFDVTAFPVMMTLLFTYLFGGAIAGSTGDYIQFLLPGILVQGVIMITMYTGVTLNTDIQKGVFDRFRSLPIWRPSALVGMLLGDAVRFTISSVVVLTLGLLIGSRGRGGRGRAAAAVRLRVRVDLDVPRAAAAHPERRDGREHAGDHAGHLRVEHLRRPGDDAGLVAGLREREPGVRPGDGGARADGRRARGRRDPDGRAVERRAGGGVRAADHAPLLALISR
jgi:hypothetical protein